MQWSTADDTEKWLRLKSIAESAVRELEEAICWATGHRGTEHAETREGFELERVVSCGQRWRTKLDPCSCEPFDDHHRATTLGAAPKVMRVAGG